MQLFDVHPIEVYTVRGSQLVILRPDVFSCELNFI